MDVVKAAPVEVGWVVWQLRPPRPSLTIVCKLTFDLVPGGVATAAADQPPVSGETFHDDDPEASLGYGGDMAILKPRGEVMITGTCHPPSPPVTSTAVGIRCGEVHKSLAVIGDRYWQRLGVPSDPLPFESMPLRWERSFGGPGYAANPVGRGLEAQTDAEGLERRPLPNIETPGKLLRGPGDRPAPAGSFALSPGWEARSRQLGKRYDDRWKDTRWPYFAEDFQPSYFCAAPRDQQIEGYWRGDEAIVLQHLNPAHPVLKTRLPGLEPRAFLIPRGLDPGVDGVDRVDGADSKALQEVALELDTIHVDADAGECGQAMCVWRGVVEVQTEGLDELGALFVLAQHVDAVKERAEVVELWSRSLARGDAEELAFEAEAIPTTPVGSVVAQAGIELPGAGPAEPEPEPEAPAIDPAEIRAVYEAAGVPLPPEIAAQLARIEGKTAGSADSGGAGEAGGGGAGVAVAASGGVAAPQSFAVPEAAAPGLEAPSAPGLEVPSAPGLEAPSAPGLEAPSAPGLEAPGAPGLEAPEAPASGSAPEPPARIVVPMPVAETPDGLPVARPITIPSEPNLPEAQPLARAQVERALGGAEVGGLKGADLSGGDLVGLDLSGQELSGAILTGANLRGVALVGTDLRQAVLAGADLRGADLSRADLSEADLTGARLAGAKLDAAVLDGASLVGASLLGTSLDGTQAIGANFLAADLRDGRWRGANLDKADLTGADLRGVEAQECSLIDATLDRAVAKGVVLRGCHLDLLRAGEWIDLREADLRGSRAPGARFSQARLERAQLALVPLTDASFIEAALDEAILHGCALERARFDRARLLRAGLVKANAFEANFEAADLRGADLRGANLFGCQLWQAKIDNARFELSELERTLLAGLGLERGGVP